jgi:hypothetical protein
LGGQFCAFHPAGIIELLRDEVVRRARDLARTALDRAAASLSD